jgi:nucleotide-binding universal stress UspA family protein
MSSRNGQFGIVVGVDDSPAAKVAVDWGAREAELRQVPLTLVHAVSPTFTSWWDGPLSPGLAQWQKDHGHRLLDDAVELAEKTCHHGGPTRIHAEILSSGAVPALTDLSKEAELIVTGSCSTGSWPGRQLGSVSSGLVRHAHCPVAILHEESLLGPNMIQAPVLVGIDGSTASGLAAAVAFDEASRRNVGLIALHAWSDVDVSEWPGVDWPTTQSVAEQALAERLAGWRERYPDVDVRRIVVRDRPARQLVTHSSGTQLVVVGSRGRGGFAGMLVGSVSEAVAGVARTPVIVTRQSET